MFYLNNDCELVNQEYISMFYQNIDIPLISSTYAQVRYSIKHCNLLIV